MAISPVLPADAKAVIPDPNSTICGNMLSVLLKGPVNFYKLIAFLFNADGTPSKAAVNIALRPGDYVDSSCIQTEDGTRLLCDGREVSQTTYPDLFAAIGATYGVASDPVNNFKIPDFRAKFLVGIGAFASAGSASLGVAAGVDQVTLKVANMPAHDHSDGTHKYLLKAPYVGSITGSDTVNSGSEQAVGANDGASIQSVGSGTAFNILPPFLGVYRYVIC